MTIRYLIASTHPTGAVQWGDESQRNEARQRGTGLVIMVENTLKRSRVYCELALAEKSGGVNIDGRQKISPADLDTGLFNFFESGLDAYDQTTHFLNTRTGVMRFCAWGSARGQYELYMNPVHTDRSRADPSTQKLAQATLNFLTSSDPRKVNRRLVSAFGGTAWVDERGHSATKRHVEAGLKPER